MCSLWWWNRWNVFPYRLLNLDPLTQFPFSFIKVIGPQTRACILPFAHVRRPGRYKICAQYLMEAWLFREFLRIVNWGHTRLCVDPMIDKGKAIQVKKQFSWRNWALTDAKYSLRSISSPRIGAGLPGLLEIVGKFSIYSSRLLLVSGCTRKKWDVMRLRLRSGKLTGGNISFDDSCFIKAN